MISPAGAVIAAICFFLPWVKLSCAPEPMSGAQLGGILWLVLIAAIAIVIVVPLYKSRGQAGNAKPIVVISALVGLGVMAYKAFQIFGGKAAEQLGAQVQFGAIGSALGLLVALGGAGTLENELQVEESGPDSFKCPKCGEVYPASYRWDACSACGATLHKREQLAGAAAEQGAPAVCPQCKRAIPPGEQGRFCGGCGAALTGTG
ncbi:MAG: zinc ribbon domain-containing protein [Candidatus Eisenbacteria bacterium]|nr:zinc ribbon domain-containing protein [Candidatus Eisenbacteria bacterium]